MEKRRFQECPWYVRLYRRIRFQWYIPIDAVRSWWGDRKSSPIPFEDMETGEVVEIPPMSFRNAWSLACGWAHYRMEYYYTLEEVMEDGAWADKPVRISSNAKVD